MKMNKSKNDATIMFDNTIINNPMKRKSKLVVMVGIPGSGKSTIAKTKILNTLYDGNIFSSDEYRLKLLGDENDQSNNQLVFSTLYEELIQHLIGGKDAILDATNISIKDRQRVFSQIKSIRDNIEVVAYFVNTPISTCIERDGKRNRVVGEDVIMKMVNRFQCPQYFEGFDSIVFHYFEYIHKNFSNALTPILSIMDDYDQKNPHHVGTLGAHCRKLASFYQENSLQYVAGLLHDIGKMRTQTIDEQGICHYYNHDSVGAYTICCFPEYINHSFSFEDCLTIVAIINFHMKFHKDWLNNNKYKNLLGEKLYNMIEEFANYDKLASGTNDIHDFLMDAMKIKKLSLDVIRSSEEYLNEQRRFYEYV